MCRKKKVQIRKYEVAFISLCTKGEGDDYKTKVSEILNSTIIITD